MHLGPARTRKYIENEHTFWLCFIIKMNILVEEHRKGPTLEKGPTFKKVRSPCQKHSRDEHRIWLDVFFPEKTSDETLK